MDSRYTLTEHGLVANFQQKCGCSAEGPKCRVGKRLWKAMDVAIGREYDREISMKEADVSVGAWQSHIGA